MAARNRDAKNRTDERFSYCETRSEGVGRDRLWLRSSRIPIGDLCDNLGLPLVIAVVLSPVSCAHSRQKDPKGQGQKNMTSRGCLLLASFPVSPAQQLLLKGHGSEISHSLLLTPRVLAAAPSNAPAQSKFSL